MPPQKNRFHTSFALGVLILASGIAPLRAEFRLDGRAYSDGPFTKFSDWIPKKLHDASPHFLEDFYELYALRNVYGEADILRNIHHLQIALTKRFRHPRNALCLVETKEQYHKYRLLVTMQIYMTIMRSYLNLGAKYDKRHLYFYNLDFADDLEKSFQKAEYFYNRARPYWEKVKELAIQASRYPFEIDLPTLESNRWQIITGELDYNKYILTHIYKVKQKQEIVRKFLDTHGRPRPVRKWMNTVEQESAELEQKVENAYRNTTEKIQRQSQDIRRKMNQSEKKIDQRPF